MSISGSFECDSESAITLIRFISSSFGRNDDFIHDMSRVSGGASPRDGGSCDVCEVRGRGGALGLG